MDNSYFIKNMQSPCVIFVLLCDRLRYIVDILRLVNVYLNVWNTLLCVLDTTVSNEVVPKLLPPWKCVILILQASKDALTAPVCKLRGYRSLSTFLSGLPLPVLHGRPLSGSYGIYLRKQRQLGHWRRYTAPLEAAALRPIHNYSNTSEGIQGEYLIPASPFPQPPLPLPRSTVEGSAGIWDSTHTKKEGCFVWQVGGRDEESWCRAVRVNV